ncbi:nickel transport system substrate-binding protein [Sporobacter termitidis DSM 10068]|uniref:Nickel transport system substrate-binding protein n=1 Tax=Sporobacter termitidis DSM 10068 TaxID=1123282 RepID=A0A1M5YSF6_9FIRM|nr:ABC transporter substrate-binding protein [Sporobacter termitidis]SHI14869.1 nickel transport system substrate-binding protein [Sporobacter termitidis DSM 10068]
MRRKLFTVLMALLLTVTSLAGCASTISGTPGSASPDPSGTAVSGDTPKTITIAEGSNFVGGFASIYGPDQGGSSLSYYHYVGNFYESLVNYDNGEIKPGLAESWKISDDGLVYTFNLRKGVKFSDGTDFNAEVVKLNLQNFSTVMGKGAVNYGLLNSLIKDVVAVSDDVLEIHLTQPYYAALTNLAMVMPRGIMAVSAYNEDGTLSEAVKAGTLGTGPYMYTGDNKNDLEYTFVRNPYYSGEKPQVDGFTVKVIPDNEAKVLALRNGEVDLIAGSDNISYSSYIQLDAEEQYTGKVSGTHILTEFLAVNPEAAPFDDIKVRQAVNQALNKQSIAKDLFGGLKTAADTIMDTALPYCDISVTPYAYDAAKAKGLLEEAGWVDSDGDGVREKNGTPLAVELKYVTNDTNDKAMLAIQQNLSEIGMKVTLAGMDLMAFFSIYNGDSYAMAYFESYGILYDPFTFVSNMNPNLDYTKASYSTDPMVSKALSNLSYDEAYELTGGLLSLASDDKITERFHYLLEKAHENGVLVPVTYRNELAVFSSKTISDYTFFGQPAQVNVAGVKIK